MDASLHLDQYTAKPGPPLSQSQGCTEGHVFLALVYQSSGLKSDNFTNPFPRQASSHGPFPDRIVLPPLFFFHYLQ
jgi:hypothetical protein